MSRREGINNKYEEKEAEKKSGKKLIGWKSVFSGSVLQSNFLYKQRWYIFLLFVLSIIYITNRYLADKTLRYNARLRLEVVEKKAEYITKSSELMRLSKRSEVLKAIKKKNIELIESQTPPKRVKKTE